jgi:hypothetical protein
MVSTIVCRDDTLAELERLQRNLEEYEEAQ